MPRLKKSLGKIIFQTTFPEEFQRYLMYELHSSLEFNKDTISGGMVSSYRWRYSFRSTKKEYQDIYDWTIECYHNKIVCISQQPRIYIRKGLWIDMTNARLVIEGHTP